MHPLSEVLARGPERAAHIGLPNPHLRDKVIEDVFCLAATKVQPRTLSLPGHDLWWVRDRPKLVAAIAECNAAPGPGHSHGSASPARRLSRGTNTKRSSELRSRCSRSYIVACRLPKGVRATFTSGNETEPAIPPNFGTCCALTFPGSRARTVARISGGAH
jgi:hypothetical protein